MNNKNNVLYKDLSYKIIGDVFGVYNKLGYGYQEKYYQRALSIIFNKRKVNYSEQLRVDLNFEDENIGRYFIDFVIDDKIALELKVGNKLYKRDYDQLKAYLKSTSLKLGILVLFSPVGVIYKRILNK